MPNIDASLGHLQIVQNQPKWKRLWSYRHSLVLGLRTKMLFSNNNTMNNREQEKENEIEMLIKENDNYNFYNRQIKDM